jgi:hypothetical protein
MGFLNTAIGTALGGVGGGILANNWGKLTGRGSNPQPSQPPPLLKASGVALPMGALADTFSNIGSGAMGAINSNYANLKGRTAQDSNVRGTGQNSYAANRYGVQQGLDTGNLEATLGGGLGDTAYKDVLSQRGYNQQSDLANQIAQLNKPSLLDQIFKGVGAIGKPVAAYAGAGGFDSSGGYGGGGTGYGVTGDPALSMYNPYASGYGRYS